MANNNHFNLELDTLAPTGSITRAFEFGNANAAMAITYNVSSQQESCFMKVWFNTSATGSKSDTGYPATWSPAATSFTTQFSTDGEYYYHLVLMDDVGNESGVYDTAKMTYDTTKPVVSGGYIEDPDGEEAVKRTITNQLHNNIGFTYSDALSGATSGRLVCTDFTSEVALTNLDTSSGSHTYTGTIDFKEGTVDGEKTVDIYVTDRAGNESLKAEAKITLDRAMSTPILSLKQADGTTALPSYINYHAIKANLTSTDTDIVGYKIWEGTEPTEWTTKTAGSLNVTIALVLSNNDGVKTVHAKVQDSAGNVQSAEDRTVTIDTVVPTATISRSGADWISNVTGFTTSEIKFSCNDLTAGVKSYEVRCNGTKISEGTTAETDKTISITSATTGMVEGANNFTVYVVDNAENTYTTETAAVIHLDTTAPTGSLPSLNTWYNSTFGVTGVSYSDGSGSGVHGLYLWTDQSSTSTSTIPSGVTEITPAKADILASEITFNLEQSPANYLHMIVKDNVGNLGAVDAKQFGYDNVKPTSTVAFSQGVYNSTSATVNSTFTDATSGNPSVTGYAQFMKLTGDITNPDTDFVEFVASRSVTLTSGDGLKNVSLLVKDAAGNIQETAATAQCELDTTRPYGTLKLYEKGSKTTEKKSPSNIPTTDAVINYFDDGESSETGIGNIGYYKIWGQFHYYDETKTDKRGTALAADEDSAQWIEITDVSAGKKEIIVSLICATGDGQKNVSVRLKDNAGNTYPVGAALTANFVYDTTAINVKTAEQDYNRISKLHVLRLSTENKYCDEVHFDFFADSGDGKTPSTEVYQAFKVCAYINEAAALLGDPTKDAPIPSGEGSAGSLNMSASGITGTGKVSCLIKGVDFENAIKASVPAFSTSKAYAVGDLVKHDSKYYRCIVAHTAGAWNAEHFAEDVDGVRIVTVYMQDAAGTWSEAAKFQVS